MADREGPLTAHEVLAERSELQIHSGGAIAVDTDDMRSVAVQLDAVASGLGTVTAALSRAWHAVSTSPGIRARIDVGGFGDRATHLDQVRDDVVDHADRVRLMADAFEYADLRARRVSAGVDLPAELQSRLEALASDPRVMTEAEMWLQIWEDNRYSGADAARDAAGWTSLLPWIFGLPLGALSAIGVPAALAWGSEHAKRRSLGTIEPGERLTGAAPAVMLEKTVTLDRTAARIRPPSGTAEAFARVRDGDRNQHVRIDKYTMADGTAQYQVFIDGTDAMLNTGDSPWNMRSNSDMYLDRRVSASYEAVRQAVADSGIRPGDTIDIVGYSQGGMIGSFLAADGDYDVRSLTTFGSPTTVALGARTLVAELRNTNELVGGALSAGGSAGTTGSKDSFVAMRDTGSHTVVGAHLPGAYERTAELVDGSGDPRVEALQECWNELDAATNVESFSYRAHEKE
ncbi:ESX-1 secretion-associated protein [Microbacterium sp. KUDC0406]|uniref:ESX-1 secretion-associated protein n=1 Tax=Microbacterium sp. KUDC0406 TaxID=2909588 RepID=UPI001F18C573|nr:ESX-1 secretion-associated protein [Microbacterium sp. KUDC0406]UJP09657.1 ESX-1 secretion-associated protein [Microbacterium sp. KUDC0406]